jgi:N-acetylneuraminic acid mutarotase
VYSPSSDAWRSAAALPETTSGALALAADNLLFLFGGTDGTTVRSSAWAYDPATDSWRPLPPMTHARAHAAGGVIDDVLYVVGGSDGVQDLAVCERFDPTTETWSQCPDMIEARGGAGAAVLLDSLYVIGGGLHQPVSHAEVFDADSDTWGVVNTPMLTEASDWSLLGVAAVETHVYAIGGRQNGVLTDSNFYYAPPMHYQFLPVQTGGQ